MKTTQKNYSGIMPILALMLILLSAFSCYAQSSNWTTADEAVTAIVEQMNTALGSSADNYSKALWLHDWLTNNAYYDTTYSAADTHEAAGVLLHGTGVCDSYSKAYVLLLTKVGIESKRVTGSSTNPATGQPESHAWNLVKINGSWTHIDVTWDDPAGAAVPYSGEENHMYFGMSTALISRDHTIDGVEGEQGFDINSVTDNDNYYPVKDASIRTFDSPAGLYNILNAAAAAGEKEIELCYIGTGQNFSIYNEVDKWLNTYNSENPENPYHILGFSAPDGFSGKMNFRYFDPDDPAARIDVSGGYYKFPNIWNALEAAQDGDTIMLLKDITPDTDDFPIVISEEKNVTIDLNGHKIDRKQTSPVENGNVITVNGTLRIVNSGNDEKGIITGGNSTGEGGGIYIAGTGKFTLEYGKVTGNRAAIGGGVYCGGTFEISGSPVIENNIENGSTFSYNNVLLPDNNKIYIAGVLSDTASIGVTTMNLPTEGNPVVITSGNNAAYTQRFSADLGADYIVSDVNSEAALMLSTGEKYTVTFYADSEIFALRYADPSTPVDEPAEKPVKENFVFAGWYEKNTDGSYKESEYDFNTPVVSNLSLHAKWDAAAVKLEADGIMAVYYKSLHEAWSDNLYPLYSLNNPVITLLTDISDATEGTDQSLIFGSGTAVLDLNGKTIDLSGINKTASTGKAFLVTGGELTLTDKSAGKNGTITGGNVGVAVLSGTFIMSGGTISGNRTGVSLPDKMYSGGGIIDGGYDRTFILSGGTITRNTDNGIYYEKGKDDWSQGGENPVTAAGMQVSGAPKVTGNGREAAPVNVLLVNHSDLPIFIGTEGLGEDAELGITLGNITSDSGTVFTSGLMGNDDSPKGSKANFISDDPAYAVGIVPAGQTVAGEAYLTDPKYKVTYKANGATSGTAPVDTDEYSSGATVTVESAAGLVKVEGETVKVATGWYTEEDGKRFVYSVDDTNDTNNTFTITRDTTLYANWAVAEASITNTGGTTYYTSLLNAFNTVAVSGDKVTVLKDVTIDSCLKIVTGKTLTLDLNGKTVDRGLASGAAVPNGSVISVEGGSLTLEDIKTGGTITGGKTSGNGGGVNILGGSFTMTGGTITGNKAEGAIGGGGVCVGDNASFEMNGGSISGNESAKDGGGVAALGSFTMGTGAEIKNNTAGAAGGGVSINSSDSRFTMNGGSIMNNSAAADGGGVYLPTGTFNMFGGVISGNKAVGNGGGIFVKFPNSRLNMKGDVQVTNNTKNNAKNNIYLDNNQLIYVTGALTGNAASVGVAGQFPFNSGYYFAEGTTEGTTEGTGYTLTANDKAKFSSDDDGYVIGLDTNKNKAYLGYTLSYEAGGASGKVPAGIDAVYPGSLVKLPGPGSLTYEGKLFRCWRDKDSSVEKFENETVSINKNTTFIAQWADPAAEITRSGATTQYATLKQALAAAQNGDTVKVLININENAKTGLNTKNVTIDLNGNNVTYGSIETSANLTVTGGGKLNISQVLNTNLSDTDAFTLDKAEMSVVSFIWTANSVNIKNGGILELKGTNGSAAYLVGSGDGFTLSIDKNESKIILNDSYIVNLSGGHERVLSELKKYASEADEGKVVVGTMDTPGAPLNMTLQYQYIVSFYGNGGAVPQGAADMTPQKFTPGAEAKALRTNTFEWEGYHFTGWNTQANGSGQSFTDQQSVAVKDIAALDPLTLYAQWSMNEYTVTVTPTGPGSIAVMKDGTAPYTGTFHKGETFSLIIYPNTDAFFDGDSLQVCYTKNSTPYCDSLSDSYTMPAADVTVSGTFYGYTLPGAITGLIYSGEAQQLITAGSVSGDDPGLFRFEYCPGEQGTAPAAGDTGWTSDAAAVKGTNAGTYYVWYRIVSVSTSGSIVMKSFGTPLEVTISPAGVTLKAESNAYVMIYSGQDLPFGNRFTVWNGESEVSGLSFSGVSASGTGKNAGEYPVTFTGVTVNETKDTTGNYVVTDTIEGTLTISPKQVTIGNLSVGIKEYDGNLDAEVNYEQAVIQGKIQGDELTVDSCTGEFDNKNAGDRNVSITCVLGGSAKGNYTLLQPGPVTAAISKKELTVTAAAQTRAYEKGNLSVTVRLQLNGVLDAEKDKVSLAESVIGTMDDDTAGTGKPVTLPTLVLKGADADTGNYSLTQPAGVKVEITRLPVTIRAKDQSVAIGGTINTDPNGTGTAQIEITAGALSGSDTITSVKLTASGTAIKPSAARVNDNDTDTGNYDFRYEDGTLTVTLPPINIQVVDEKDNDFAGVDLKLTGGSTDLTWTSSANDPYTVTGLLPNVEYTLKETDVSNINYKFTADTLFSFDASGKIAYNNADKAADWDESTKTLTITNNPVSVTVRKVDENENRLAGALLWKTDEDGTPMNDGWTSSDQDHIITNFTRNVTYGIHEVTSPDGYIGAPDLCFTITADGRSVTLDPYSINQGHSIADDGAIEFLNKKTSVSISKVDENGDPVSGAKLQVKDTNGNVVNLDGKALEWDSGTEAQVIKGLPTSTDYILHEAETPAGYIPAADLKFRILSGGNLRINDVNTQSSSIGFVNTRTSVSIKKVNTAGNALPGAVLQILQESDGGGETKVHEWTSTDEAAVITGKLAVGVPYILRETVPPAGYGTATDVTFELKADGTIDTDKTKTTAEVENGVILFRNEPTSVSIKKVDLDSGYELPGANLQILRESDGGGETIVHEWKSGNDAEVVTGKLAVGVRYILRETVPPAGYKTAADVYIQLKADGTIDIAKTTATDDDEYGTILFENEPTSVSIYVVDREHPETKVAGADVTLNPNPTHQWTSSGTDAKTVSRLTVGTEYTLTVTGTPENYDKPDSQTFKVKADGTVEALTAELDAAGNIIIKLPRINYTVTFDFDGGNLSSYNTNTYTAVTDAQGKITGLRQTVNRGSTASNPGSPSKDGYGFDGWYLMSGGTMADAAYEFTKQVTEPVTLKAKWTPNKYKVKFNGNGSNNDIHVDDQEFTYDVEQTLDANQYERVFTVTYEYNGATGGNTVTSDSAQFSFNGWALTADGTKQYDNQQSVSNLTTENDVTVELFAMWNDAAITLPTPTKTGYTFGGWYSDEALAAKVGDGGASYTPNASVTLYAKWTENTETAYTVEYYYQENGSYPAAANSSAARTGTTGTTASVSDPDKTPAQTGYALDETKPEAWSGTIAGDGSLVLKVYFKQQFTVTWQNWDGTVLETDENLSYGAVPAYDGETPVRPADDDYIYIFKRWTPEIVSVTADAVYTAVYNNEINTYTVKVIPGANMTKTAASAAEEQRVTKGSAISAMVYTTGADYYFPADYAVEQVNGISVTRDSETQITVSGTPAADTVITVITLKDPATRASNTVADPKITLDEGTYTEPQTITITGETEGAVIWYTTDGSDPSDPASNRKQYTGEFVITETSTIRAYAEKDGMFPSKVFTHVITIELPPEPWEINVDIHNFTNTGAKGVPGDVPRTEFSLTIQIVEKESGEVVSTAAGVKVEVMGGPNTAKISLENVEFDRKVEDLSEAKYMAVVRVSPSKVSGVAPMNQVYTLTNEAWPGGSELITIYLKWDDGKRSEPERIKVYALPEDEIGAYTILKDGTKEYLIFHTYDICMRWLGSDELCRGYERCFHKENPYVNPFVTATGVIGEIVN